MSYRRNPAVLALIPILFSTAIFASDPMPFLEGGLQIDRNPKRHRSMNVPYSPGPFYVSCTKQQMAGTIQDEASTPDGQMSYTATFGFMGISASNFSPLHQAHGLYGNGRVQAVMDDRIIIQPLNKKRRGTKGWLTARLNVDGEGGAQEPLSAVGTIDGASEARYSFEVSIGRERRILSGVWLSADGGETLFRGKEISDLVLRVPFRFGQPMDLSMSAIASTSAIGGDLTDPARAFVDLMAQWQGLSVEASKGKPFDRYTIQADSGFDWSAVREPSRSSRSVSVPEPSWASFVALALPLFRRRR